MKQANQTRTSTPYAVSRIGSIPLGVDGWDEYLLIESLIDETSTQEVHDWLLQRYYMDTTQEAGGYFCTCVTVVPKPYALAEYIGIVHHRYDV